MFRDREDAGNQLGDRLAKLPMHSPLVLAIPRGGVVTGAAIAERLGADLDVVLAHKLRSPSNPELAFGAIGEGDLLYLDPDICRQLGMRQQEIERERAHQLAEIERRHRLFRRGQQSAPMAGRSVILTDDGIATGSTVIAAIRVIRQANPKELILAVPVAPPDRLEAIGKLCDRVICLEAPPYFQAVGQFYDRFDTVSDDEVAQILVSTRSPAS